MRIFKDKMGAGLFQIENFKSFLNLREDSFMNSFINNKCRIKLFL